MAGLPVPTIAGPAAAGAGAVAGDALSRGLDARIIDALMNRNAPGKEGTFEELEYDRAPFTAGSMKEFIQKVDEEAAAKARYPQGKIPQKSMGGTMYGPGGKFYRFGGGMR